MNYACLITGSRKWTDRARVESALQDYGAGDIMIHGGAEGADTIASEIGEAKWMKVIRVGVPKARYDEHGAKGLSGAPHVRNRLMVDMLWTLRWAGYETEVLAFPMADSTGTPPTMAYALERGLDVANWGHVDFKSALGPRRPR